MLEVADLSVAYGSVQVLWDVSLKVGKGEIVSVLGPNGAGKSTLLQSIMGMLHPMRGEIRYRDRQIGGLAPEETVRLGLALITEEKHLFLDMTVLDNLLMGSYIQRAKERRKESLQTVFELFPKLAERKDQIVKTLSGGERQMVAIGRALMSQFPDLLLIDEPSVGLTPLMTNRMLDAIKTVNRAGVTVLLVEQNVYLTLEMSHRAYVLESGRITLEGKGPELLRDSHIKKAYLAI